MKIEEVIGVYEKQQRAAQAALRAGQEYNVTARAFMAELSDNLPDTLAEEMLVHFDNSDVWIVTLNLEDWCIAGLRKIAVFDLGNAKPDAER